MPIWSSHISHRRVTLSPFSSEQMALIGVGMVRQIFSRITEHQLDVTDSPALPLSEKYAKSKVARGKQMGRVLLPVRDWVFTSNTMSNLIVKSANEDQVRIGFGTPRADDIVRVQNRRCRMWGTSPADQVELDRLFGMALKANLSTMIRIEKVA